MVKQPLVDTFGRQHNSLRISVTDRCNIRCFYCMPNENVKFLPRAELLTFEEIVRLTKVFASLGVTHLRLTGGEPLVRGHIEKLVAMLKATAGIQEVAMTSNAVLLPKYAKSLKDAGLDRLNISLDALDQERFLKITRRDVLDKVLAGIDVALDAGFKKIRINAVAIAGLTEPEIIPLAEFALAKAMQLRFIEFMPLDAENNWDNSQVLSGQSIRESLTQHYGPLVKVPRDNPSQPAVDYKYSDGKGVVGFINPVSEPFCSACNRLRITSEGKMRNCLFSDKEWDLRAALRGQQSDRLIAERIALSVAAKKAGHEIGQQSFIRPQRSMFQIGG